jgi:hypothetical protein
LWKREENKAHGSLKQQGAERCTNAGFAFRRFVLWVKENQESVSRSLRGPCAHVERRAQAWPLNP